MVIARSGIPAQRSIAVGGQAQFLLEVLAALVKLEVVDIQRRAVVVLLVKIVVVLVARIGGQGGKAQVVVDQQSQGKNVSVVFVAVADIRIQFFIVALQGGVRGDVFIEGIPDVAPINGAVHGARLLPLLVFDDGIHRQSLGLVAG